MGFRTSTTGTCGGSPEDLIQTTMFKQNPEIVDVLVGYRQDNGKMRPGCKISLWVELGNVKLCVNDDHMGRVGFAVLNTGLKLSQAIEEVLDANGIEWRPNSKKKANS